MIKLLAKIFLFILFFPACTSLRWQAGMDFFGAHALAGNPGDIIINEIAWMGSPPDQGETAQQSANDEWVELYNPTQNAISLDGWILKAKDGQPVIALKGTIASGAYLLLSRANEKVGGIAADIVYPYKNNALLNTGEDLQLFDPQENVVDEAGATTGWFAGDNSTKQTMERKTVSSGSGSIQTNWTTSVSAGGTPKARNSTSESPSVTLSPTPQQTPTPTPTQAPTPSPSPEPTPTQIPTPQPTEQFLIQPSPTPENLLPKDNKETDSHSLIPIPTPTPSQTTLNILAEKKTSMSQNLTPTPKPEKSNAETLKKVLKKYDQGGENKNLQSSPSTTTPDKISSAQTASLYESSEKEAKNLSVFLVALPIALLSAVFIFLLKRRA